MIAWKIVRWEKFVYAAFVFGSVFQYITVIPPLQEGEVVGVVGMMKPTTLKRSGLQRNENGITTLLLIAL